MNNGIEGINYVLILKVKGQGNLVKGRVCQSYRGDQSSYNRYFLSESLKYTCIYFFHFWRRKAVTITEKYITHEKYLVIIHVSQISYECLFVRVAKILKFKIVIAELFLKIYFDTGNSLNNPPTPLVNTWLSFLLISEIGEYCFGEFFV